MSMNSRDRIGALVGRARQRRARGSNMLVTSIFWTGSNADRHSACPDHPRKAPAIRRAPILSALGSLNP
jgi:hypothetical protein